MNSKRSHQQRDGSKAQNLIATLVDASGRWIARRQDEDFGLDLELELSEPEVRGELLKVQIKSVATATIENRKIRMQLPRSLVAKAENLRIPVLLVWVDRSDHEAYYLWVQRWFLRKRTQGLTLADLPETITVWVPTKRKLRRGLERELIAIAQWKTSTQLTLSLTATIKTAVAINNAQVLASLHQLLVGLAKAPVGQTVDEVIDSVIAIGRRIWATESGYKKARLLYDVCRSIGDRFTPAQIERMVLRHNSYSRTGINALGHVYDHHIGHLVGMRLPRRFARLGQPAVAFYCALREAHPGKKVADLIASDVDLVANGLRSTHERLLDKWINRGDSAVLDYLQSAD